jgi:hypothetical protein
MDPNQYTKIGAHSHADAIADPDTSFANEYTTPATATAAAKTNICSATASHIHAASPSAPQAHESTTAGDADATLMAFEDSRYRIC